MFNKIKTLKQFISEAQHIEPKLIRAVVNQLGGWDCFKECAQDITNHGMQYGIGGFVWYSETVAFWRKNRKEILTLAELQASDFDEDVIEMVRSFNGLSDKGVPDYTASEIGKAWYGRYDNNLDSVYNALAWYAAEEIARAYCDLLECE